MALLAALGASVFLHLVPPFEFKPFLSFRACKQVGQSHEKCPVLSQV